MNQQDDGHEKTSAVSRREILKLCGVAGGALQVGGMMGAGLAAGRDPMSYPGWESFEGATQFFDRKAHEIEGEAPGPVGQVRRPAKHTEYIFGRAGRFHGAMRRVRANENWEIPDLLELLPGELVEFYDAHPGTLELDIERETVLAAKAEEDREKYGEYFRLADAWSNAWADVFRSYPPRVERPSIESDFAGVHPQALAPKSPELAAQLIKKVAHHFGATLVGICKLNPAWVYDVDLRGEEGGPAEVPEHWTYAIAIGIPHEWEQVMSNPAHGTSYDAYARCAITAGRITAFLKSLGYPARPHHPPTAYDLIVPPILVDAGLGQQGRHGVVLAPEVGANLRAAVVTTNLEMACDRPIDFGAADFCVRCKICAEQCPSGAISFADSNEEMTTRGWRHWEIDGTRCFNFWQAAMGPTGCRLCIAVCPYSRRDNWVHELARNASGADSTGLVDEGMIWMQKKFFDAPSSEEYLPPPDGRFAGYRPAPSWLDLEQWFDVEVTNPQQGG